MAPPDDLQALRAQLESLAARVRRLETQAAIKAAAGPVISQDLGQHPGDKEITAPPADIAASPTMHSAPPKPPAPPLPPAATPLFETVLLPERESAALERRIGQVWLNRVGIIATLIGVSYFLKFAFDNHWIGESGRIALGLLAGIALILWSERFRTRGYKAFSYSLKAIGTGTLYLSLWAAYQLYHLIPGAAAFAAMIVVTSATTILALTQDSELLAGLAMLGGFATPVLVSTGQNHEIALFTYVALLDVAAVALAAFKPWRALLWGAFLGSILLYCGWYLDYYTDQQRPLTVFFVLLLAAIFAAVPLFAKPLFAKPISAESTSHSPSHAPGDGPSLSTVFSLLPFLNASALFLALLTMYEQDVTALTWHSLALGGAYLLLARATRRRFHAAGPPLVSLLHVALAIVFITVAIPLKLRPYSGYWTTNAFLLEAAALLWIAGKHQARFIAFFGIGALTIGVGRLLFVDEYASSTLFLNARFGTHIVALVVLGLIVYYGRRFLPEDQWPLLRAPEVAFHVIALIALTREASAFFDQREHAQAAMAWAEQRNLAIARQFTYSAIWLVYGAALLAAGFTRRSAFLRWQGLAIMGFTIAKVFLYDTAFLERGYRIVSFLALGAVLLAVSYAYHRDWLQLAAAEERKSQRPAL